VRNEKREGEILRVISLPLPFSSFFDFFDFAVVF
jgi:hypothetical protein